MMEVILFLILWAVRFFRTICFIDDFSKNSNTYVSRISRNLCKLKASKERPKSMPTRIKKKILNTSAKLNDNMASGKK